MSIERILSIINEKLMPTVDIHKEERCTRPPGLFIIGDAGAVIEELKKQYEPYDDPEGRKYPVIYINIPEKPKSEDPINLAIENYYPIWERFTIKASGKVEPAYRPFELKKSHSLSFKMQLLWEQIRTCETKLLVFTGLENILPLRRLKRLEMLNLIKSMYKHNGIPAVLVSKDKKVLEILPEDMPVNWVFELCDKPIFK